MKDGCKEPIPINIGGTGSIGIVSVDCLAVAAQNAAAAQGAQQTPPAGAR